MPTHYQTHGRKHYQANKAKIIARVRANNDRLKQEWHDFKASLACAHCGASHPAIFDFHHINPDDPDKQRVNELINKKRFTAAYKEVKEKCLVLCANCHRIHHYNEHRQKTTPDGGASVNQEQKNTPESESSGVA